MPTRKATAIWEGGLKEGKGSIKTERGITASYGFLSRFGDGSPSGTNPEELLAAAHAGCYSMALAANLEGAGTPATKIETSGACSIEKAGEGFKITKMALTVRATVPGISAETFHRAALTTKEGCPVSGALKAIPIELDAQLV
jgi:osmotically inducible protein OsmC